MAFKQLFVALARLSKVNLTLLQEDLAKRVKILIQFSRSNIYFYIKLLSQNDLIQNLATVGTYAIISDLSFRPKTKFKNLANQYR